MSYEKQTWATGDTISGAKLNHIEEGVEGINMSYEKTTWQSGDTITAEKLNNIEDGIAGAGGGDFTPITVTVNVTSSGDVLVLTNIYGLQDDETGAVKALLASDDGYMLEGDWELDNGTTIFNILLAPDGSFRMHVQGDVTSIEGAIVSDMGYEEEYIISGDCVVNVTKDK